MTCCFALRHVLSNNRLSAPPNKCMQAAWAKAIWFGHSMLTPVDEMPLISRGDAREPDAKS